MKTSKPTKEPEIFSLYLPVYLSLSKRILISTGSSIFQDDGCFISVETVFYQLALSMKFAFLVMMLTPEMRKVHLQEKHGQTN